MIPKNYYGTKHWISFSKSLLDDHECTCDICHRGRWKLLSRGKNKGKWKRLLRFVVHHKHYETIYKEDRKDVLLLCSSCHTNGHKSLRSRGASLFHEKVAQLYERSGFLYKNN